MIETPYAWMGDVETFLRTPEENILRHLTRKLKETGSPQLTAWDQSWGVLRQELQRCMPAAAEFVLVLEFELPRTGGRRPDLILLQNGIVLVLEFKNRVEAEPADFDQVRGYVQHLKDYHAGCRDKTLLPVLVPIGMTRAPYENEGVQVLPPHKLGTLIRELSQHRPIRRPDGHAWTHAPYDPLPALVEAARLLFEKQPLPWIKQAESAKIHAVVALIESTVRSAVARKQRVLVMLTGVPGSGKTLVGLQLVHSRNLASPAVFLSGNGPLIQVLQYSLGRRQEFVQDIKPFLRHHLIRKSERTRERIVVFDEAQRAWDRNRVIERHQGDLAASEPELLLRVAEQGGEGFGLVALMGEGQEIHAGEESGIQPWIDAVRTLGNWEVVGPTHLAEPFRSAGISYREHTLLNLTTTLRSHRASRTSLWVELVLQGKLIEAKKVALDLRQNQFTLHMTRDLERLQTHIRERYEGDTNKRYGVLVSSKFRSIAEYGIRAARHPYYYYGEWYSSPPGNPRSSCQMDLAVSEFGCQGLELDYPLLCWGPDLTWDGTQWKAKVGKPRKVRDPQRLRLNAYRVLLSRGRDGVGIFVPSGAKMDQTYKALRDAGVVEI